MKYLAFLLSFISVALANASLDQQIIKATKNVSLELQKSLVNASITVAKEAYSHSDESISFQVYLNDAKSANQYIYSSFMPKAQQMIHAAVYNEYGDYFVMDKVTGKGVLPSNRTITVQDPVSVNAKILASRLKNELQGIISGIGGSDLEKRFIWGSFTSAGKAASSYFENAGRMMGHSPRRFQLPKIPRPNFSRIGNLFHRFLEGVMWCLEVTVKVIGELFASVFSAVV